MESVRPTIPYLVQHFGYDNAPMDRHFASLKSERVPHRRYLTRAKGRHDIFHCIEVLYNRKNRHSALRYMSPDQLKQSLRMCANWYPLNGGNSFKQGARRDSDTVT